MIVQNFSHILGYVKRFKDQISSLEHVKLNGDEEGGIPNILNLSFAAVEGESLLMSLSGISLSSGSACTSATLEPSYVLRAIGIGDELAHSSIRFGFGRFTTEAEVDYTAQQLVYHVRKKYKKLRSFCTSVRNLTP